MPVINVLWAKGPDQQKKAAAAAKIVDAVYEATGMASICVNFQEVDHDDFFAGHDSLTEVKCRAAAR